MSEIIERLTAENEAFLALQVANNELMDKVWAVLGGTDATREGGQSLLTRVTEIQEALAAAKAERDQARAANECDRTEVIDAVNAISDAFKRRYWLLGDSRGSYEWDDDRFRQEFRDAIAEFEPQVERLRKIGADRSNCPTTQAGVDAARSSLPALAETRKKALEEAAAIAGAAMGGYLCPYGRDKPGDPTWDHTDDDICPVCRVNSTDAIFKCHDTVSGRIAAAIRALAEEERK